MTRLVGILFVIGVICFSVVRPVSGQSGIAAIWVNNGEDKVTQDELRVSRDGKNVTNSVWNGTTINLFGGLNEVVEFNIILEAPNGANNVSVSFNTLTGPNGSMIASSPATGNQVFSFVNRNIELFYLRYLAIRGLSRSSYETYDERHVPQRMRRPWTGDGQATGTWQDRPDHDKYYPDIAIPMELIQNFNVAAGKNQSVWVDVFIPKNASPGLYQGSVVVQQGGSTVKTIPVQLTVYNFMLPDAPSAKTMLVFSSANINKRYSGSTWVNPNSASGTRARLIRDRHFLLAHRHRISLIGDDTLDDCGSNADQPCPEWLPRLNGSLFTAANAYDGPGIAVGNNVYSVGTYGAWSWRSGTQSDMNQHSNAWASWFAQNAPSTEYFLYLIDESSNYPQIQTWAQWIASNPGPGHNLKSMATISLPTAAAQTPSLDIPTSTLTVGIPSQWQPLADQYTTDARKRFYMYNAHRPASGSTATEDDGVALRELTWVQYKKHINRWFHWESTYYNNYQGGTGETNVFQSAQTFGGKSSFDSVLGETGWNHNNGDGVFFYPGTDSLYPADSYGVDGPFASLRLKHWRRGLEDVEYLTLASAINPAAVTSLVNAMVPKALWEYGVSDPNDPTWVRSDISWSVDPNAWESARQQLANIITGAPQSSPSVSLTAPTNGATLSGTINLAATASDPIGIAGVQFLVDGATAGAEVTTSPYSLSFNTATISNGSHSFAARARNMQNVTTTSPAVTATVNNSATPGQLTVVSALTITPGSPAVDQAAAATFIVQNTGGQPISMQYLFVAARDPSNTNVDFPATPAIALQPGQQYTYQGSRSFGVSGTYSAWPSYFDGTTWPQLGPSTGFNVPQPGNLMLTSPLSLSPVAPRVNQTTTATFAVRNSGGQPISVGYFLAGGRDQSDGHVDFPVSPAVTLQPGQQYTYSASQSIATAGKYTAWPAYFDGSNWIELAAMHSTFLVGSQTTVRIEQSDPSVQQGPNQWSWSTGYDSRASGGSYIVSKTAGSALSVSFNGIGISIIGIVDGCSGQGSVSVDGTTQNFDNYRPEGAWQQVIYSVSGLTPGYHTLTLTVSGTNQPASCGPWVYIDAFDIVVSASERVEDTSSQVVKGPNQWSWSTGYDSRASGGSYIVSKTAGSALSVSFNGTGISIIGIVDGCSGQGSVSVDGTTQNFDNYRPGGAWQQVIYSVSGLTPGYHTLTLTVSGTNQPASCGPWVYIDAFDIQH
jgi:hypothetical protein